MTPTSGVEFLVWLLIVAAIIAMFAKRLRIPYTVSLVVGGVLLGALHIPLPSPLQPGHRPDWLTPDVILILFLPALIFEGSVKLDVRELLRNSVPLLLLANAGVLINSCPRPDIEALSANPPHCPCQSRNPITSGTCATAIGRYEMGARLPALPRQQNF